MPEVDQLTHVLHQLDAARTRATYGAVAGHLDVTPRFLMRDRPRDPLHSWVVSKKDGRPTGYPEELWHPDLLQNDRVIERTEDLETFLGGDVGRTRTPS